MPVCIAGMHRSGTSMVTKMLHTAGLYLGSEADLAPNDPDKLEHHFENKRFVRLNARILAELGGAWDCPPPITADWADGRLPACRIEASALLADFAEEEPWGWKDPRSCLTLPFWQSLLGAVPVVFVVRNPLEVAHSLRKRNGFSHPLGLMLWQAYNDRLWEAVSASDRIVTHYDTYFTDPEGELRRILRFLHMPVGDDVIERVRHVHVAEMRHHDLTTRSLHVKNVPPATLDLYYRLCDEANWRGADQDQEARDGSESASEEAELRSWGDPHSVEFAHLREQRQLNPVRRRQRRKSDDAEARIVDLERTVAAQRLALAKFEELERELMTLRQRLPG